MLHPDSERLRPSVSTHHGREGFDNKQRKAFNETEGPDGRGSVGSDLDTPRKIYSECLVQITTRRDAKRSTDVEIRNHGEIAVHNFAGAL